MPQSTMTFSGGWILIEVEVIKCRRTYLHILLPNIPHVINWVDEMLYWSVGNITFHIM